MIVTPVVLTFNEDSDADGLLVGFAFGIYEIVFLSAGPVWLQSQSV
jgi:hypothetical protein